MSELLLVYALSSEGKASCILITYIDASEDDTSCDELQKFGEILVSELLFF